MRVQNTFFLTILGLMCLAVLALAASPAQAAVSNSSRIDVGPSFDVRVNEPFPVTPTLFSDSLAGIEIRDVWWDTNPREERVGESDGVLNNDRDVSVQTFTHPGIPTIGDEFFTIWVNYSDNKLLNATLEITVVANQAPVITPGSPPSGIVGDPITFRAVVTDPDSPEASLVFAWDFDVQVDADTDGQADNDIQSALKSNVTFVYSTEGTYTAKLRVTDDYGASDEEFIIVTVQKPPGITERTVEVEGGYKLDNVSIQRGGWVTYHFVSEPGRTYEYNVQVTNGQNVYVMVQLGKEMFQQYDNGVETAYQSEWSVVNTPGTSITIRFKPDRVADIYVTVDNGYLFDLPGAHAADTTVIVQDVDRNNILAQIPSIVWIALALVGAVVVSLFLIRFYFESSEARKARQAKEAVERQEKASARGELDALLSNPDEVVRQKYAPRPGPAAAVAPPPMAPRPGPAPRPAGPQQAPGPQPPRQAPPAVPCRNCGNPLELGFQICPSCGTPV